MVSREIVYVESHDSRICGWYVTESTLPSSDWVWRNCGNGPEVVNDGIYGPYESEAVATGALGIAPV